MLKLLTNVYSILLMNSIISFLLIGKAFALSCAPTPVELQYLSATVVFSGTVTSIEDVKKQNDAKIEFMKKNPEIEYIGINEEQKVTLAVDQAHKGELSETIEVYENTYWGGTFRLGKKYLVFAHHNDDQLNVGACGGMVDYQSVKDGLVRIKQLKALIAGETDHIEGKLPHGDTALFSIDRQEGGVLIYQTRSSEGKVFYTEEFKIENIESSLLKTCPELWFDDQMPTLTNFVGLKKETRQYFIFDGQRRELAEFDMNWVTSNCNIKPEVVY